MDDTASRHTLPKGVRLRSGSIQIYFERNGKSYHVTLPHPATAAGISAAVKIRRDLITKADWGVLTEADLASARGEWVKDDSVIAGGGALFQEVAQRYLKHCEANPDSKKDYMSALNKHWMPELALIPIHQITSEIIRDIIADAEF